MACSFVCRRRERNSQSPIDAAVPVAKGRSSALRTPQASFIIRLCGEKAESGGGLDEVAAPNLCFGRPPGIALSAVPFVGDDMGRVLRVHGCCYSIPTSAGISPFGARSSDGYLTSDAIFPSALRPFLKMNRIDHGVHSWLPLWGGSTEASLCCQRRLDSVLAMTTIWAAPPIITRAVQPKLERKNVSWLSSAGRVCWIILVTKNDETFNPLRQDFL